jgi:hypothetical protein
MTALLLALVIVPVAALLARLSASLILLFAVLIVALLLAVAIVLLVALALLAILIAHRRFAPSKDTSNVTCIKGNADGSNGFVGQRC